MLGHIGTLAFHLQAAPTQDLGNPVSCLKIKRGPDHPCQSLCLGHAHLVTSGLAETWIVIACYSLFKLDRKLGFKKSGAGEPKGRVRSRHTFSPGILRERLHEHATEEEREDQRGPTARKRLSCNLTAPLQGEVAF